MTCDRQIGCGFYKALLENGVIQEGQPCVKPVPVDCPRHQVANGINVKHAQNIFKVDDVYGGELPLTAEEIAYLYPNGA